MIRRIFISSIIISIASSGLCAQENTTTAGGKATGNGGSVSYSIGQVVYTINTDTNGSVAQGVQQPYEILIVTEVTETTIELELSVYPNPTTDFLTLKVDNMEGLTFELRELQGKVINSQTVNGTSTKISLETQSAAIYLLTVTKDQTPIKTFQIIKN